MTTAIYVRVSTDKQTAENQLADLYRLAQARGLGGPTLYSETESAAKKRPVLENLMTACRRGEHRTVLVWALDRLDRSMYSCIGRVLELDRLGVTVVSLREPWLDTSGPVRSLLVAIFGWVAEQERERLIERTKAGLARAKRAGKKLGRPRASPVAVRAAADLVRAGRMSIGMAARQWGIGKSTLHDFLKENPREQ